MLPTAVLRREIYRDTVRQSVIRPDVELSAVTVPNNYFFRLNPCKPNICGQCGGFCTNDKDAGK
jgi:hypothetical protein